MDQRTQSTITRRRLLKGAGLMLCSLVLEGCRRRLRVTPVPKAEAPPTAGAEPTLAAMPPSAAGSVAAPVADELAASTILFHGKIITVDDADTIASAVAVKDGRIQAVGSDEAVLALRGDRTEVVDLAGKAVTPGLIDAHNHLQVAGLMNSYYVPLLPPDVRTMDDLRAKLAAAVAQTPEGEWVKAYFMVVNGGGLPTKHDLDPVSPHNPVWVMQQGGHYGSTNSLGLQEAGIDANTPDPTGGVIGREAGGQPSGVFYNHRAMDLVRRKIPQPTMDMVRHNVASVQPMFSAAGVTSFHDNNVRGTDTIATYLDAGANGPMSMRGTIYYTLEWPRDLDRALTEIDYSGGGALMRFGGFKFLLDGQLTMAFCHEPHNGERWNISTWEPATFKAAVRALHDTGLQICVHCVGDAAVDLTLDAFEEAMNANPRPDPRHRIEHCILSTPEATQRMKDLGVVVSTQPQFLRIAGDYYPVLFGEDRAARAIVTREWLDAGVPLALGSDSPTTPWLTPQVTMFGAVSRVTYSNQRFHPEQAISVAEALRAHTMGSAYAGHQEENLGSIEVGKLADLAVWSADPYSVPLRELWKLPVELTMLEGEVVHQM